jgi:hypothetical protein
VSVSEQPENSIAELIKVRDALVALRDTIVRKKCGNLLRTRNCGGARKILNLWPYLWPAAPNEIKEKLRLRWKAAKISPRVSG